MIKQNPIKVTNTFLFSQFDYSSKLHFNRDFLSIHFNLFHKERRSNIHNQKTIFSFELFSNSSKTSFTIFISFPLSQFYSNYSSSFIIYSTISIRYFRCFDKKNFIEIFISFSFFTKFTNHSQNENKYPP